MNNNQDFGKFGEDLAVNYLINKGYQILERNWRSGHKEIDIIALDGDTLVAVEVKTRKSNTYGEPDIAVGAMKQQMLIWAADAYVRYKNLGCGGPVRYRLHRDHRHGRTYRTHRGRFYRYLTIAQWGNSRLEKTSRAIAVIARSGA